MKTSATAKFVGTSARKTGLVAALIRGRRALDAQVILINTEKRASGPIGKVLASAIANAENNHNAKAANLLIESVLIGPGPTLKRSRPRAKGSASAIRKRSSHITVVVTDAAAIAAQGKATSPAGAGSVTAPTDKKANVRQPEVALTGAAKATSESKTTKKEAK